MVVLLLYPRSAVIVDTLSRPGDSIRGIFLSLIDCFSKFGSHSFWFFPPLFVDFQGVPQRLPEEHARARCGYSAPTVRVGTGGKHRPWQGHAGASAASPRG